MRFNKASAGISHRYPSPAFPQEPDVWGVKATFFLPAPVVPFLLLYYSFPSCFAPLSFAHQEPVPWGISGVEPVVPGPGLSNFSVAVLRHHGQDNV